MVFARVVPGGQRSSPLLVRVLIGALAYGPCIRVAAIEALRLEVAQYFRGFWLDLGMSAASAGVRFDINTAILPNPRNVSGESLGRSIIGETC